MNSYDNPEHLRAELQRQTVRLNQLRHQALDLGFTQEEIEAITLRALEEDDTPYSQPTVSP
jgi:hypothetical protein